MTAVLYDLLKKSLNYDEKKFSKYHAFRPSISKIPLPNSNKFIYLGDVTSQYYADKLNIDIIISFRDNLQNKLYEYETVTINNHKFVHHIFHIDDNFTQESIIRMNRVLPFISDIMKTGIIENKIILVHCMAGVSRSPTAIIYFLVTNYFNDLLKSVRYVKYYREIIYPNDAFIKLLIQKQYSNKN